MKQSIVKKLSPKIFSLNSSSGTVKIAYPLDLFEKGNIPQLLSSIAGNIFGMKEVENLKLLDVVFPVAYFKSFKGPRFGIEGIRKIMKIPKRPLVGTIVKPKLGLNSSEHAKVAFEAWIGGCDLVKCDENLTSQKFNKFETNLAKSLRLLDKAEKETGEKKMYVPNVTAETREMIKRVKLVKEAGGTCAMVDMITVGWSALQTLRENDFGLVIHAHRAGHAMFTRHNHGISMLAIAKMARLAGVSQLHIGTANVGKMESGSGEVEKISSFLKSNWHGIKSVFPIASGGLHAGSIPRLVEALGTDIIIQAGGGVSGHNLGVSAGATSLRQAVDAVLKGIPLEEYGKTHKELKSAIDKWGVIR
jgi:ribulose-bisphosphate carboxylase large chain